MARTAQLVATSSPRSLRFAVASAVVAVGLVLPLITTSTHLMDLPPAITIHVGSHPEYVPPGTTFGEMVTRFGLRPKDGDLVAVDGRRVAQGRDFTSAGELRTQDVLHLDAGAAAGPARAAAAEQDSATGSAYTAAERFAGEAASGTGGDGVCLGRLRRSGESAGPVGAWTYTNRHALRIGAVSLAALIFVFWGQPTAAVTIVIVTGRPSRARRIAGAALGAVFALVFLTEHLLQVL